MGESKRPMNTFQTTRVTVQRIVVKSRYRYGKVTGAGSKSRLKMKTPIVPPIVILTIFSLEAM